MNARTVWLYWSAKITRILGEDMNVRLSTFGKVYRFSVIRIRLSCMSIFFLEENMFSLVMTYEIG